MLTLVHSDSATALLAAGRNGGRAAVWIIGWLVVLGAIVATVVYLSRRRRRPHSDDPR